MEKNLKTAIKIIIPVIFLAVGIFLGQDFANLNEILKTGKDSSELITQRHDKVEVSLMIDYGNGEIDVYEDVLLDNPTVFELLKKVTGENKLEFSFNDKYKDLGILVESINGKRNDFSKNQFWQYWVNNRYANVASDKYQLKNSDVVLWKLVFGQQ